MHIPDNEGKVCDAVVRTLETRTGVTRTNMYRPEDQTDRQGSRVELCLTLGKTIYAIEHTRIEAFRNQIKREVSFALLVRPVIAELNKKLPGPALYDLILPLDRHIKVNMRQLRRIQDALACWIRENAEELHKTILDRASPNSPQRDSCLSMKLSKAAETQRMSHRGFQSLCHIRVRTVQLPPTSL